MSEVDRIFAAFDALSKLSQEAQRMRDLRHATRRRCGSCCHWMKSRSCPQEHNVNGQSRGPSCEGIPCGQFTPTAAYLEDVERYRTALKTRGGE